MSNVNFVKIFDDAIHCINEEFGKDFPDHKRYHKATSWFINFHGNSKDNSIQTRMCTSRYILDPVLKRWWNEHKGFTNSTGSLYIDYGGPFDWDFDEISYFSNSCDKMLEYIPHEGNEYYYDTILNLDLTEDSEAIDRARLAGGFHGIDFNKFMNIRKKICNTFPMEHLKTTIYVFNETNYSICVDRIVT